MRIRLSIFSKLLIWFFLNLVLLATIFVFFFQIRFHVPPDSVLAGTTSHKTISLYRMIRHDLASTPEDHWDDLLKRYADGFDAELTLITFDGRIIAGSRGPIPIEVTSRMWAWHRQFTCNMMGPGMNTQIMRHNFRRILRVRTVNPVRYWLGLPMPLSDRIHHRFMPAMLLISTDSLTGSGFFPDIIPVAGGALAIIVISLLWWFPMVRHITRPLKRMTRATEEIADGHFGIRVDDRRQDEIGRLGRSINIMSERLETFITGQKRFLSDVAHELCSPLARLKMGLGVLEDQLPPENQHCLRDVAEEADNISELVNEILSFSRAEISPSKVTISLVNIKEVVAKVLEREKSGNVQIISDIPTGISAMCNPDLLARALANLLRNAIRYAGDYGPIKITANRTDNTVTIDILDSGPGIPEECINRIFDPFFRIDQHRNRQSGGTGLGLSIVKTCIEACGGTVRAQNMAHGGLKMTVELPAGV